MKPKMYPAKQPVTYFKLRLGKKAEGRRKLSALSKRQLDNECCSNIAEVFHIAATNKFCKSGKTQITKKLTAVYGQRYVNLPFKRNHHCFRQRLSYLFISQNFIRLMKFLRVE